jgi:hypothetical protein
MADVQDHYDGHLGPIYAWMVGGVDAALRRGADELADLGLAAGPAGAGWAVDLGAGFGMHAIPLADHGYEVLAIDTCAALLETLADRRGPRPIRTVHDDLLAWRRHLPTPAQLVLCMNDTLTHLPGPAAVERLLDDLAAGLASGGRFVASFRDYTIAREGPARFIPVRSDASRILTCFLEYGPTHVTVHDLLHEREGAGWRQRVSAYRKLRLAPTWLVGQLAARGLAAEVAEAPAGMVRVTARQR